ncbi:MAG: GGDEF domain-containing protein [Candidatus Rokubacteria bacterium]|nr:GGDEF domain-containing protein [Candidatus Rokubacteria bacterium]
MRYPMERQAAFAGQRVKQKICLALTLSSVIPMLILTYSLYAHVLPFLDPVLHFRDLVWFEALLIFTGLLMLAGGFVIWDLATAVSHAAAAVTEAGQVEEITAARSDEIGTLMASFTRMLGTIKQQAAEVSQYAERLEGAYRELELTSARLKEFSFTDEVTGLYNRRFFSVRLEEEVSRSRRFHHPVSVVMLDVDGLNAINDALGRGAGDETLRIVADIITRYSRGINVVCRHAADTFAVLLVETAKTGAGLYAERIRQVLAAYPFAHGRRVTASFGVASLPEDVAPSADELIRAAGEALFRAKRAGKDRICLYEAAPGSPVEVEATRA